MSTAIKVGIVTPAFFYVPYWAAADKGWYREAGLDVEVIDLGGIDAVTAELKAGRIHVGVGSPEHVIHDVEAGGELRMVGGNVNRLTHSLIARPGIERLEDLRGRQLGVSALSGGTSSLFVDILERVGLRYPGDYTMVEAGPVIPRHAQLMSGEIDAGMQTDPHNYLAEDAGLSNLGPVSQWIPYFQFTSVNVRQDWAAAHGEALTSFLAASIRGSQWMFSSEEGAAAFARERMGIEDRYARRAWRDHVESDAVPVDLHLDDRSIQTAIAMIRRDRSSVHRIPEHAPSQRYVAGSYLREAQRRLGLPERVLV